jgi:glucosamine kinase
VSLSSPVVAGVDAGATRTRAAILDRDGTIRGTGAGGPGSVRAGAVAAAADTIANTFHSAVRAAGVGSPAALVVGAAGAGPSTIQEEVAAALRARGAPRHTVVTTDAEIAFADAFGTGTGILILAGTGSIALARDPGGAAHRAGGVGWRYGDEGSGYALGRAAIAAVSRALDGRGPHTVLETSLPAATALGSVAAFLGWTRAATVEAVAALGGVVQAAAEDGDPTARGIVDTAARDIIDHVRALAAHFPAEASIPVILGGGALQSGGALHLAVVRLLRAEERYILRTVELDPARGAAHMARRLLAEEPAGS